MQEITEQRDVAQEISEAFSQRAGFGEDFDEVGSACVGQSAGRMGRVENGEWSAWLLGRAVPTVHNRLGALNSFLSLIKE